MILIVDDDTDAREALGELLRQRGYSVICAENGEAAFNQIRNWNAPPALILLDLFMPIMGGQAFLRRARADRRLRNVPIIVTTADPWAEPPEADAILSKPLRPETLIAAIRRFLDSPIGLHSMPRVFGKGGYSGLQ